MQQAGKVAVDWFPPASLPRTKEAADACGVDPRVESSCEQRQHAAFTVAKDSDRRVRGRRFEPIDKTERHLHFVTGQRPAEFKRRAMQVFAARQIGATVSFFPMTADQLRHNNAAAGFRQMPRDLRRFRYAILQSTQLFGRLIGVGQHDDVRDRFTERSQQ